MKIKVAESGTPKKCLKKFKKLSKIKILTVHIHTSTKKIGKKFAQKCFRLKNNAQRNNLRKIFANVSLSNFEKRLKLFPFRIWVVFKCNCLMGFD
jgi:hypothetical protein